MLSVCTYLTKTESGASLSRHLIRCPMCKEQVVILLLRGHFFESIYHLYQSRICWNDVWPLFQISFTLNYSFIWVLSPLTVLYSVIIMFKLCYHTREVTLRLYTKYMYTRTYLHFRIQDTITEKWAEKFDPIFTVFFCIYTLLVLGFSYNK